MSGTKRPQASFVLAKYLAEDVKTLWGKVTIYLGFGNYTHPLYAVTLSYFSDSLGVTKDTGSTSFNFQDE